MQVDFSPFYSSTVGYDPLFTMLDSLARPDQSVTYPPYNIERTDENLYRITMAVAGFDTSELNIELNSNMLTIRGEKAEEEKEKTTEYLHRGIAKRSFERHFQLADFVEVKTATIENGLLHIELLRNIPERMKPRNIKISQPSEKLKTIETRQVSAA
ncbi:16 kDa heat shock protein A [Liberibacter crescens BT-1]|uniref:16 kDa heat shock protein A n=2 Tax=Liberibacter crescens TaxID=1273132 RepID=L0EWZ9_LIBCB|nr:16 kDa heat shock protein A [Liberibacter crescens BT-1]AMC13134.1 heat-shock protein [Liberibacter crescens]